jgi:fructoselysine-6-P-deglycase FrlB-like protein
MKIDKEFIDKQDKKYAKLCYLIMNMESNLRDIDKYKGRSLAFRNLENALRIFQQQVDEDHRRFNARVKVNEARSEVRDMQQTLNRERKLREELESKIKEASESSGLFISYVREKLGL